MKYLLFTFECKARTDRSQRQFQFGTIRNRILFDNKKKSTFNILNALQDKLNILPLRVL